MRDRPFVSTILFGLAMAAGLATAGAADAGCDTRMSRIPVGALAPVAAPKFRAAMLRVTPPAAAPKAAAVHRAPRKAGKADVRRHVAHAGPARHKPPAKHAAHHASARAALPHVKGAPTPVATAARQAATPVAYALISATLCETGPASGGLLYPLRARGFAAPAEETPAAPPGPDPSQPGTTFLPPTPGLTPTDEGSFPLVTGTPPTPPLGPPVTPVTPPLTPPVTPPGPPPGPPVTPPETGQPPVTPPDTPTTTPLTPVPPPVTPPTPPVTPPVSPPIVPPIEPLGPPGPSPPRPPGSVPEPASWMMMILGFGMLGLGLRRREEARASRAP
jgi:hypothetical protein